MQIFGGSDNLLKKFEINSKKLEKVYFIVNVRIFVPSSPIKVLLTRKLPRVAEELLSAFFQVDVNNNDHISKETLKEAVQSYDAILSILSDVFDEEVFNFATRTKIISNYAVGLDNIDLSAARKKNIFICNLPDIVTNSTADLTFAIFLSLIRKVCEAREFVKNGNWKTVGPNYFVGEELFGKNFGILGFGRIGRAVAKRALAFGLKVFFYNRSHLQLPEELKTCVQVSKDELLARADYLSLHLSLNEETKHMVDFEQMKKMKRNPILINVARGAIVKTEDLIKALQMGILRGAALDVTDPEPLPGNHPLCSFPNCLVVPHIGTATLDCRYQMAKKAAENIISFFKLKSIR